MKKWDIFAVSVGVGVIKKYFYCKCWSRSLFQVLHIGRIEYSKSDNCIHISMLTSVATLGSQNASVLWSFFFNAWRYVTLREFFPRRLVTEAHTGLLPALPFSVLHLRAIILFFRRLFRPMAFSRHFFSYNSFSTLLISIPSYRSLSNNYQQISFNWFIRHLERFFLLDI